MKKNIPIIILCGGRGKRLGKITKKIPKPLIKIKKKVLLEQKLDYYQKIGIKDFYICIGYKGYLIQKYLSNYPAKISYSSLKPSAGILERVSKVLNKIKTPAIISYGDTLAKIELKKLYNYHLNSKALMTIVVSSIQNPFGIVKWNSNKKVIKFKEKPIQNHFIGYAVISHKILDIIPKKILRMNDGLGMVKAIQYLSNKKKVNIFKFEGLQITVNSINDLENAKAKSNKYFTF